MTRYFSSSRARASWPSCASVRMTARSMREMRSCSSLASFSSSTGTSLSTGKAFSAAPLMTRSVARIPAPADRSAACQVPGLIAVSGSRWTMPFSGALPATLRMYSSECTRAICSNVASGAVGAFKGFLGISSPSKVMAGLTSLAEANSVTIAD